MARYLFASHDGFGLGHVRRNTLIARAVLASEPDAAIVIVTGLPMRPTWLGDERLHVVGVAPMLKNSTGSYRHEVLSFEAAVDQRSAAFHDAISSVRPDVVVIDRHPYGVAGELRPGLDLARAGGAAVVLGLRDILDQAVVVRTELAGEGWADVSDMYDEVLVYGERILCDHEAEYGLPVAPRYCGWVADLAAPHRRQPDLIAVTGGGGGDGADVFRLGVELADVLPQRRIVLVAGPYATKDVGGGRAASQGRLQIIRNAPGCARLFARAGAVVQMAGYNSTYESLAAGLRPVLVPRRSPRREQAIRASRLAALGIADVVDETAPVEEVAWLLDRSRILPAEALADAGIRLDGARRAADAVRALAAAAAGRPVSAASEALA